MKYSRPCGGFTLGHVESMCLFYHIDVSSSESLPFAMLVTFAFFSIEWCLSILSQSDKAYNVQAAGDRDSQDDDSFFISQPI